MADGGFGTAAKRHGARSRNKRNAPRIDAAPHPGPLPSDGRGNNHWLSWVGGWLSGQCSRGFPRETADDSPSPLSAVGPAKADGGEGRGEVEPLHRALHSAARLRSGCGFVALSFLCFFAADHFLVIQDLRFVSMADCGATIEDCWLAARAERGGGLGAAGGTFAGSGRGPVSLTRRRAD